MKLLLFLIFLVAYQVYLSRYFIDRQILTDFFKSIVTKQKQENENFPKTKTYKIDGKDVQILKRLEYLEKGNFATVFYDVPQDKHILQTGDSKGKTQWGATILIHFWSPTKSPCEQIGVVQIAKRVSTIDDQASPINSHDWRIDVKATEAKKRDAGEKFNPFYPHTQTIQEVVQGYGAGFLMRDNPKAIGR